ncbi:NAD(P)/FAD-dependent oxidoreductase [Bacillus salipaludis]|uniref:NAD(P)/FAD-dependent oxidoreductase n=1 Tax=Bacillus salipaludis TaxID=2547811 RepID=UPI002E2197C2|nr:NAD(P)/FAD-dependent oxidoreductase [Bacillus salipaludis]
MNFDCIIVGGGIAGLQAAIQLGRYKHKVLVIDSNHGRSTLCKSYHNILGWPNGISGQELRQIGKRQAENLGVEFKSEVVDSAEKIGKGFQLKVKTGFQYVSKRLLLATGIMDRIPSFPELLNCLGISVYVCPDCDGYEVKDKSTIVIGAGNVGAKMALTLSYWTQDLMYINHEKTEISEHLLKELKVHRIHYVEETIQKVMAENSYLQGFILQSGKKIMGERGFIAFGGNEVKSKVAKQLGVELLENQHIVVNPRTKMTNIPNVWAAGDVVAHSEQVTIAMGDGSAAAIWIHKSLMD